jgi:uncharacterized membrane protein
MFPCLAFGYGYWWIFPIIMIAMMVLCFFMMRGHGCSMMCGPGFGRSGSHSESASDRPPDILNRKNSRGEINKQEYEEKKKETAGRT